MGVPPSGIPASGALCVCVHTHHEHTHMLTQTRRVCVWSPGGAHAFPHHTYVGCDAAIVAATHHRAPPRLSRSCVRHVLPRSCHERSQMGRHRLRRRQALPRPPPPHMHNWCPPIEALPITHPHTRSPAASSATTTCVMPHAQYCARSCGCAQPRVCA